MSSGPMKVEMLLKAKGGGFRQWGHSSLASDVLIQLKNIENLYISLFTSSFNKSEASRHLEQFVVHAGSCMCQSSANLIGQI